MTPQARCGVVKSSNGSRQCAIGMAFVVSLLAIGVAMGSAGGASAAELTTSVRGTVTGAGAPLSGARVTVLAGSREGVSELGHATTATDGSFEADYAMPPSGVLYVEAVAPADTRFRLRSVLGVVGGGVAPEPVGTVTLNELTTVATTFALAQFGDEAGVSGPSPGLENAAATAFALADPADGTAGSVVTNGDNGAENDTLATLGTLANLVSLCADDRRRCGLFMRLATPPGEPSPGDTVQALLDLARRPSVSTLPLHALSRSADTFEPALGRPPSAWVLVLLYTQPELYASGRIAIDAKGNLWSSTNWLPGTQEASTSITVLDPVGRSILGSPIEGGGMKGGAWGAAIAEGGTVWMGSFGGDSIAEYSGAGVPLSPSGGWTEGEPDHPQGIAVDQKGNVWIANNFGPESAPGEGAVIVYPEGDPSRAVTISGGGLNHPFAIQIDGYGRAWVTNAGLGGARLVDTRAAILVGKFGGSVTVIDPDFQPTSFSPIENESFKWPLGLAIDSRNNAWTVNFNSSTVTRMEPDGTVAGVYDLPRGTLPWSEAVDGSDRVWVAGFGRPGVWLLCGLDTSACPPGSQTGTIISPRRGFRSDAFQHFTSIQIDQSGNVWLSNNWSHLVPPVGGTGIAEIVGVATPVCTPLTPLPATPSAETDDPCPPQAAAALPAGLDDDESRPIWVWVAVGAAAALLIATAAVLLLGRRRSPAA